MDITKSLYYYKFKSLFPKSLYDKVLSIYFKFRASFYYGSSVVCPICGNRFKRFIGNKTYGNCPYCNSGSRHRAMFLFLIKRTNFFSEDLKVLHFAPEYCFFYLFRSMRNLNYISGDLDPIRAQENINMENIHYPNDFFDVVISSHVLEHVNDDSKAIKELYRVQNKSGFQIHMVPIDSSLSKTYEDQTITSPKLRKRIYGHFDHKRIYGVDFIDRLSKVGFSVTIYTPTDYLQQDEIMKYGVSLGEKIFYCKKV